MSKKVVFFFPSFASSEATAPLGILAVATPLLRAGFSVKLIDSTITPDYKKRVLEEVKDALCLAISLVTGPDDPRDRGNCASGEGVEAGFPDHSRRLASVASCRSKRWKRPTLTSWCAGRAKRRCWKLCNIWKSARRST